MKTKIFLVFLLFFVSISFLSANVMVTPQEVVFEEGGKRTKSIKLVHRGNKKMTYRISLIHYKQVESGAFERTEVPAENENFADDIIRFSPKTVTLYPQSESSIFENKSSFQIIRLRKYFKKHTPDGEYRSHLLVTPIPESELESDQSEGEAVSAKKFSIKIRTLIGVSIPLIVRKGNLEATIKIQDIKIEETQDKKTILNFTLLREGNRSVRGDVYVTLDGKKIGIIKKASIYLSTDKRNVSVGLYKHHLLKPNEPFPLKNLRGKTIKIEYKETKKHKEILWAHETYTIPAK